ncbi:MAG: 5-oxoprolinase subunit PxpA [Pseudomonadota bacterium]
MSGQIDLNADLGEGCAFDADLMEVVTSCNIACGGHVGDARTMREALSLAADHGVAAGAHPSFPDGDNFGRSPSLLRGQALEDALLAQTGALKDIGDRLGVSITHVKPHGALYNMAARDADLAESVLNVLRSVLPGARLVGPPASELERAAADAGVLFLREGFADRAYEPDGHLRDRSLPEAMIIGEERQVAQACNLVLKGEVQAYGGTVIPLPVETICVHGDTEGAVASARAIRRALEQAGWVLCAPG